MNPDENVIHGLPSRLVEIAPVIPVDGSDENGPFSEIHIPEFFPPGSILLWGTQLQDVETHLDEFCKYGADKALLALDLVDLNVVLHRADGEERDATNGEIGTYNIPGHGNLVYAGLEGWMALLRPIMRSNDLGHALCHHLRRGTWALDYIHDRLMRCEIIHCISSAGFIRLFSGKQPFCQTSFIPRTGSKSALSVLSPVFLRSFVRSTSPLLLMRHIRLLVAL